MHGPDSIIVAARRGSRLSRPSRPSRPTAASRSRSRCRAAPGRRGRAQPISLRISRAHHSSGSIAYQKHESENKSRGTEHSKKTSFNTPARTSASLVYRSQNSRVTLERWRCKVARIDQSQQGGESCDEWLTQELICTELSTTEKVAGVTGNDR